MADRGFKELTITPCSHQDQQHRYPPLGGVKAPSCQRYRNNLAALSQHRNYLFVAYADEIHVFKPQLPAQLIPGTAELVLSLPKTSQGLKGYIDTRIPHAVNHLVVADLGIEEVLVAACDDGDVIAYSVRSIYNAIRENHESAGAGLPKSKTELRALLLTNVGTSAWGIAVHKAARLIAVSSNHHRISVFAFSLRQRRSAESVGDKDIVPIEVLGDILWEREDKGPCSPHDRSRNVEIILEGHTSNIPNIAFCNTETDRAGDFLISTDIFGSILLWNIWRRTILAKFTPDLGDRKRRHGWGVACLDPRMYHLTSWIRETFGGYLIGEEQKHAEGTSYDNTANSLSVQDSSSSHPAFGSVLAAQRAALFAQGPYPHNPEFPLSPDDIVADDEDETDSEPDYFGLDMELEMELDMEPDDDPMLADGSSSTSEQSDGVTHPYSPSQPMFESSPPTQDQDSMELPIIMLPFDILFTSKSDIRVLYSICIKGNVRRPDISYDSVRCIEPMYQKLPRRVQRLAHTERLNMILQIPELGAIVIGNQIGRVMLLTMTTSEEFRCGFRVDWLLPLKSQEEKEHRPEVPLLGMAVSPIQGRETMNKCNSQFDPPDPRNPLETPRTHRLFLLYCDHTILSYEITRSPAARDTRVQHRTLLF